MEPPFSRYALDFLEDVPGAIQLVTDFLDAIVKYPEHHDNRFTVSVLRPPTLSLLSAVAPYS
jgi:hypothetical protein